MAKQTYVCTKIRLYNFLSKKGFIPISIATDKYDTNRLVWIYKNSPELEAAIEEYYSEIKVN